MPVGAGLLTQMLDPRLGQDGQLFDAGRSPLLGVGGVIPEVGPAFRVDGGMTTT